MSKFAKLFRKVVDATKAPQLPDDHTWSQASMAAQRAKGAAHTDDAKMMATRRAQWTAIKAVAALSGDKAFLTTVYKAEVQARDALVQTFGEDALTNPTEKHRDELYGLALRLMPMDEVGRTSVEVRDALARIGYATAA